MRIHQGSHPELWKMASAKHINMPEFIDVSDEHYNRFRKEAETSVPHLSTEGKDAWAAFSAHTHPDVPRVVHTDYSLPPKIQEDPVEQTEAAPKETSNKLEIAKIVLLAIITMLLCVIVAKGEPPPNTKTFAYTYELDTETETGHVHFTIALPQNVTPLGPQRVNLFQIAGVTPGLTGSSLNVNCTGGCAAGTSFSDNTAFTAGTTAVSITAGWFSNAPTSCTSGNACAPSLTSDRKLFVQSFQGTSPWVVSASGNFGVTQQTSPWVDNITQWASTALGVPTNFGTTPGAVIAASTNSSLFLGTTAARTNQTTTAAGVVDVNVVGSLGVTNSVTNGTFTQITDNTTKVAVIAGTSALKTDMSSVAGTATVTGAAGVQAVAVRGNANATMDVAQGGATAATNAIQEAGVFNTTQPTLTTGQGGAVALTSRAAQIVATGVDTLNTTVNTALPTGANTIGKVDVLGNAGAVMDAAQNAAQPANNLSAGGCFNNQTGTTGAITAGNSTCIQTDNHGLLLYDMQSQAGTAITTVPVAFGSGTPSGNAPGENSALFVGTTAVRSNQATTATGAVDTNIVGVKGTTIVTAAAGVIQEGIVGNAAATLDSTLASGTSPTNGVAITGKFNTTQPTPTNGQSTGLQTDSAAALEVNPEGKKTTYRAATAASFAPTNTIIFTFFGSSTKTIRVTHLYYSYSTTGAIAAGQLLQTSIVKRSTADSAGTCTTLTQIPIDANDAAGTATFVNSCTANPTTGTSVGTIVSLQCLVTNDTGTVDTLGDCKGDLLYPFGGGNSTAGGHLLVLRGTAQGIEVQVSAAIPATSQAQFTIEWTEE